MFRAPKEVKWGALDEVLSEKPVLSVVVLVIRWQPMNDKKVLLICDGGNDYLGVSASPTECIYGTCRAIVAPPSATNLDVQPGVIVQLRNPIIQIVSKGEKVLKCSEASIIGSITDQPPQGRLQPHPMSRPGNPERTVNRDSSDNSRPVESLSSSTGSMQDHSPYSAQRNQEPKSRGAQRAAPYGLPAVGRTEESHFVKIEDMGTFVSKWTIRGRVTSKSDIREFIGARGASKYFSIEVIDQKDGPTIRCSFWGNTATEKFFDLLVVDRIYTFSKGNVTAANKKYQNPGNHSHEIRFGDDAVIVPVESDDPSIPSKSFSFTSIKSLLDKEKGTVVDVRAVVTRLGTVTNITLKSTGKSKGKRDITLVDASGTSIDMTIWEPKTKDLEAAMGGVEIITEDSDKTLFIVVRAGKIEEFQGIRLGTSFGSDVTFYVYSDATNGWVWPTQVKQVPELEELRAWYLRTGKHQTPQKPPTVVSRQNDNIRHSIQDIIEGVSQTSNPDELETRGMWFTCLATVKEIPCRQGGRKFYWEACPNCKKKVQSNVQGTGVAYSSSSLGQLRNVKREYFCENCKLNVPKVDMKYNLQYDIRDSTQSLRCMSLGENADSFMGAPCEEVVDAHENAFSATGESFEDYFSRILGRTFVFKICAKNETYMDERKIRYKVYGAEPIESVASREIKRLLAKLSPSA